MQLLALNVLQYILDLRIFLKHLNYQSIVMKAWKSLKKMLRSILVLTQFTII